MNEKERRALGLGVGGTVIGRAVKSLCWVVKLSAMSYPPSVAIRCRYSLV